MRKKIRVIATIILLLSMVAVIFLFMNAQNEKGKLNKARSLPVPGGWQVTSTQDTLIKGLCVGSGSECGFIMKEYSTGSAKDKALDEEMTILSSEGWVFGAPQTIRDEIQVTARQEGKLLYLSVSEGRARIRYEENH